MISIIMPKFIDDGMEDLPAKAIEKILKYTHTNFKLILIVSDRSCAENRNIGMKCSDSEFIVFLDDDCFVGENWLEDLLKPFKDENVGMVGHIVKAENDGGSLEFKERMYVEAHCMALRNIAEIEWNEDNPGTGGNDFDMCEQVREKGYKIIGYHNLNCKHVSQRRNANKVGWINFKKKWGSIKRELP